MTVSVVSTSTDPDGDITTWAWDFGDGMTAMGASATHTYAAAGDYMITLTVTDAEMLSDSATVWVTAIEPHPPVASIAPPTMDWMTVSVVSTSTDPAGDITTWDWNFGDGMTASGESATHTYAVAGDYMITLKVTDAAMLSDSATVWVTAIMPSPPVASIGTPVVDWLTVTVTSTSTDPDNDITTWAWDFGDGATASGMSASHTYATKGMKTITLVVTDAEMLSDSVQVMVELIDNPPVAEFSWTVNGLEVSVDASILSTDDHGIVSYVWSWGDGSPDSTGSTATHVYPTALPGAMSAASDRQGPPPPPFNVFGLTMDETGAPLYGCTLEIKNMRTGAINYTTSVDMGGYGYYEYNLNDMAGGWLNGDLIQVTATLGTMSGVSQANIVSSLGYLYLDVVLAGGVEPPPPYQVTITLTVTDILGQTSTVSHVVTVVPPAP